VLATACPGVLLDGILVAPPPSSWLRGIKETPIACSARTSPKAATVRSFTAADVVAACEQLPRAFRESYVVGASSWA
jgi:hypothetical protein